MLRVSNTLTGQKEPFTVENNTVKMYVCGITPYDSCHIGHARCYVVFDIIRKYLQYKGYKVIYVQNFTDIDDKIINRAHEIGASWKDIANKYIDEYYVYSKKLNIMSADKYPRVTEYIPKIIKFIETLISKGNAYIAETGDVYFSISSFQGYGKLSHKNVDDLIIGARVEPLEKKRNPLDFVLWKSAKPGEPFWESPWGKGRPGWHIECSTMSLTELDTETLDIHGGGQDLIFPHHENEIAQSESYTGKPFSRYWIHNGFITINKEKMSKSAGNIFALEDLFKQFNPMTVRYFLLTSHYRKYLEFTVDHLVHAKNTLKNINATIDNVDKILKEGNMTIDTDKVRSKNLNNEQWIRKFEESMDNDFNTESALSVVHEIINEINIILNSEKKDFIKLRLLREYIRLFLEDILSIDLSIYKENERLTLSEDEIKYIENLIEERAQARKNKDWSRADNIRNTLLKIGIHLEDTRNGTRWKKM